MAKEVSATKKEILLYVLNHFKATADQNKFHSDHHGNGSSLKRSKKALSNLI